MKIELSGCPICGFHFLVEDNNEFDYYSYFDDDSLNHDVSCHQRSVRKFILNQSPTKLVKSCNDCDWLWNKDIYQKPRCVKKEDIIRKTLYLMTENPEYLDRYYPVSKVYVSLNSCCDDHEPKRNTV